MFEIIKFILCFGAELDYSLLTDYLKNTKTNNLFYSSNLQIQQNFAVIIL